MKDDVNVENTKFSVDTNKRSDIDHQSWVFFHELLICTKIFSCVLIWFFIAESNKCVDYLILNFIREIFSKCIFSSILRTACSLSRFQKTSDRRLSCACWKLTREIVSKLWWWKAGKWNIQRNFPMEFRPDISHVSERKIAFKNTGLIAHAHQREREMFFRKFSISYGIKWERFSTDKKLLSWLRIPRYC